jgi:4-hydroxy-tetrahydrodipicolinate synthase
MANRHGGRGDFGRLITAMVTPFKPSGEIDFEQAQRLALALLAAGSDGLVVAGTTGEAPTLSTREELDLWRAVKEAVGDRGSVWAATSSYNTAESIEVSQEAVETGIDGLLLVVPYYNKPPQEGLFRHMTAIAEAVDLPCVIYNIPGRTGVNMAPETIVRAAQAAPNIIGVKEASGSLDAVSKMGAELGPGFRIWSGDDQLTLPMLAVGGYGTVCVSSHLVGSQIKAMIEAHVAGRTDEAGSLHRRLLPLMNALMTVASNPIPVKHALNELGFNVGPLRLPLTGLDEAASVRLMAEVSKHEIDLEMAVRA